jgi:hypothetical protein
MNRRWLFALVVPLAFTESIAHAGRKPKITLACVAGETVLPSKTLPKVEGPIVCTLRAKGYKGDASDLSSSVYAKWGRGDDADNGEALSGPSSKDGDDIVMRLGALEPGTGYPLCKDFTIAVSVDDPGGTVWKKEIKIKQRCPKAK